MKWIQLTWLFLLFSGAVMAQKAPKFTVEVSTDSILLGNYFQVKFTLENANGENFQAPVFEGFQIVSGPNVSSSISIVNGEVSQTASYTFYLEPNDIGNYYIQAASIQAGENVLETTPLQVIVVPNPEGVIQKPKMTEKFDFDLRMPDINTIPAPKSEEAKPQAKKRKIYKM